MTGPRDGSVTTLNSKDIIERIMAETPFTRKESRLLLETVIGIIVDGLADGQNVHIHKFGRFSLKERKPHGLIESADRLKYKYRVHFKPGEYLNKALPANRK